MKNKFKANTKRPRSIAVLLTKKHEANVIIRNINMPLFLVFMYSCVNNTMRHAFINPQPSKSPHKPEALNGISSNSWPEGIKEYINSLKVGLIISAKMKQTFSNPRVIKTFINNLGDFFFKYVFTITMKANSTMQILVCRPKVYGLNCKFTILIIIVYSNTIKAIRNKYDSYLFVFDRLLVNKRHVAINKQHPRPK